MSPAPITVVTRRRALIGAAKAGVAAAGTTGAALALAALAGLDESRRRPSATSTTVTRSRAASSVASTTEARPLRPPGALDGDAFAAACIGCFRCAEVCPPQAIRMTPLPSIDPARAACTLCMQCGPVCPTGALAIVDAAAVRIGVASVDEDRCRAFNGKPCRLCFDVCPYAGAAIRLDARLGPHVDARSCVGCGLCEEACPERSAADVRAIRVRRQA